MAAAAELGLETTTNYHFIDDIAELAQAREVVRQDAWALLHERKAQLASGDFAQLPLQIDALSTAKAVIESRDELGNGSAEHVERLTGLRLDCRRLLGEWYRKRTWEYFPPSRHYFDAQTGEFFSHGLSVRQMTENALTPQSDNPEEEARRVNERVEDETPRIIQKLGGFMLNGAGIRTISQCTDKAVADYELDIKSGTKHRGYDGYVPEIEKVMIRDITIDPNSGDRFEEQVGVSGRYFTPDIFQRALKQKGLAAGDLDKTQLHGAQILASDNIVEFLEHMDQVASEEWRVEIFMGEEVPADFIKDYSKIREQAARRQADLEKHTNLLADFIISLAENGTDPRKAPAIVENFVKKMLLNITKHDEKLAVQVFDENTANGLREVVYLESIGQSQRALERLLEVENLAPGGGFCGAGSCGLEGVEANSIDAITVKDKLGFGNSKDILKDTERKCKCGSKSVYYDLKQAKKGCTSCGKTAKF